MEYPIHYEEEKSEYATHNLGYALSGVTNKNLISDSMKCVNYAVCVECFHLLKTIQIVEEKIQTTADNDIYDASIVIENIITYMKHQLRDAQQRKAKKAVLENLENGSVFWLRDFAQKILPCQFREGQKQYFEKKGISLHVDVMLLKEKMILLCCTVIYRCSQEMKDILNIADIVLEKFKNDEPNIAKCFVKSDNSGCYHGNVVPEALSKVCQKNGVNLYDFSEPCKGKDQCDRESSASKSLMSSYIDAGCDIITGEDVFTTVHYGNGLKHSQVCVAEISEEDTILQEKGIKKFSDIQFPLKNIA